MNLKLLTTSSSFNVISVHIRFYSRSIGPGKVNHLRLNAGPRYFWSLLRLLRSDFFNTCVIIRD